MSDKNKNKKSSLTDFIRYRNDKMSGKERNAFERKLQKDPFSEEAAEGFSQVSADEVIEDITLLQKRLHKKINSRLRVNLYRIAAAFAVLTILSGILFVIQRKNQVITLSENISQEIMTPATIPVPEPIIAPTDRGVIKKQAVETPAAPKSKSQDIADNTKIAEARKIESQQPLQKDSEKNKMDRSLIAEQEIADYAYAAEDNMEMARAAGVPAYLKSEKVKDYLPPQPVIGIDSFNLYIEKNILNPEPENSEQQVVVVIFQVHTDSLISDIKIVSSPGNAYSGEAIRLIRAGPLWKPAERNGKIVQDSVIVRIVFR